MNALPENLGREELLALLRPLYPNGIFPLAPGWWIVMTVCSAVAAGAYLFGTGFRMRRRRRAFTVLAELRQSFSRDGDISALSAGVSILLRRSALSRFGREATANLEGAAWLSFLERTGAVLTEEEKTLLTAQAYAPPCRGEECRERGERLVRSAENWMRRNL